MDKNKLFALYFAAHPNRKNKIGLKLMFFMKVNIFLGKNDIIPYPRLLTEVINYKPEQNATS